MLKVSLLKTVYEKGGLFFRIFQTYSWEQRKLGDICMEMLAGGDIDKEKIVGQGKL